MKLSNYVSILFITCIAVFVLAACADNSEESSGGSGEDANSSGQGSAEDVTLTFLEWTNLNTSDVHAAIQAAVSEQHPHITIDFENIDWENLRSTMQTRIATSTIPDIVALKGDDIPQYANEGYFVDLTSEDFMNEFPDSILEDILVDGSVYAVPYTTNYQGIFYNRDLFDQHNVEVPQTLEEFHAAVATFEDNDITPFVAHFQDYHMGNMTMQLAMAEVFSKQPNWGIDLQRGDVSFQTSEGYKNVFEHTKYYFEHAQNDAFGADATMAAEMFARGDIAMWQLGTWIVDQIMQNNPDFEVGMFAFPGGWDEPTLLIQPDHTFLGSVDSDHPEAVQQVLEVLATNKELAQQYIDLTGVDSLLTDVAPTESHPYHEDIAWYQNNDRLMNVNIGNIQVPWPYQEEYSSYLAEWLFERISLDEALERSDAYKDNVNFPQTP